jgi:hypothetical protein
MPTGANASTVAAPARKMGTYEKGVRAIYPSRSKRAASAFADKLL